MEDKEIVNMLFVRKEAGLEIMSQKYSSMCAGIIRRVLENPSDVEECVNDVRLDVWKSIPPNKPDNLRAYLYTLSRNAALRRLKYNKSEKRNSDFTIMLSELDDIIPAQEEDINLIFEKERFKNVLEDFLRSLPIQERALFVGRYFAFENDTDLSLRLGISENSVRVKLFRLRKKLKEILIKEDINL